MLTDGTTVRWSPAQPAIGDLVRLEATVPAGVAGTGLPARAAEVAASGSTLSAANGGTSPESQTSRVSADKSADSARSGAPVGNAGDYSASAGPSSGDPDGGRANGASPAGDTAFPVSAPSVKSPSAMIAPASVEYLANGTRYVWSFRVTGAGEWSFVSADKAEKIWTTATVAGNATELKKLDAGGLWKGTLKKAPPAKPASGGGSPAAGNSAAPQSIPQSPSQGMPVAPGQSADPGQSAPQSAPAPKAVTL